MTLCGKKSIFLALFLFQHIAFTDNFENNTHNNHGMIGLINMPTARIHEEGAFASTFYYGHPDQKLAISSSPYKWLEASIFYTNIKGRPYGNGFDQDYKDKGFSFKIQLKEEDKRWPAIAIGINDFAGTGLYSSEYIVGSYGIRNLDLHFGLGWGNLNDSKITLKNPFSFIDDSFLDRPNENVCFYCENKGGKPSPSTYFSDKNVSPFFGISYLLRDDMILKVEYDSTKTPGQVDYVNSDSNLSIGLDFPFRNNFLIGASIERGNTFSLRFNYRVDTKKAKKRYEYKKSPNSSDNKITNLRKSLNRNGIGVNKIYETDNSIGLELTQFTHPNLQIIEEIIKQSALDADISKEIKHDLEIVSLKAYSEIDQKLIEESEVVYMRNKKASFNTNNKLTFRPFLASREGFFKGAILLENNSEVLFSDNLTLSTNLKYSLVDNFDDLIIPPVDTYPNQVRSDIKDYLRNFNNGVFIGRAQVDYFISPNRKNHFMLTAGILEEMFSGYGFEYLRFEQEKNFAYGFKLFNVKKRDYKMQFGHLNYETTTGHFNFYYRNYDFIPFDFKTSLGKYLAGDIGTTVELSRTYSNGVRFGFFASFTDVTSEQFGEGSFDKGIFFNIPIYGEMINYSWRPLTKDPGAKLIRKNSLYDLLVRFKPIN